MRLRYTLPALTDLDAILEYIGTRSPKGAARVKARIQTVLDLLLSYPHIGATTDDPTIRRITTTPYPFLIFYEIADEDGIRAQMHQGYAPLAKSLLSLDQVCDRIAFKEAEIEILHAPLEPVGEAGAETVDTAVVAVELNFLYLVRQQGRFQCLSPIPRSS